MYSFLTSCTNPILFLAAGVCKILFLNMCFVEEDFCRAVFDLFYCAGVSNKGVDIYPIVCVFTESWRTTWVVMSQREMHHCCCRPCWPGTLASSGRKVLTQIPVAYNNLINVVLCVDIYKMLYTVLSSKQTLCSNQWYHHSRSRKIPCIALPSLQTSSRQQFLPIHQGELHCRINLTCIIM